MTLTRVVAARADSAPSGEVPREGGGQGCEAMYACHRCGTQTVRYVAA